MIPADWIPHRRDDGELVGYVRMVGDDFEPMSLFGHAVADVGDWLAAEEALEEQGLAWLAEPWMLTLDDGGSIRVRITEITPERIRVKFDDFGAVGGPLPQMWELPVPEPGRLAAIAPGTPHPGWDAQESPGASSPLS